MIKRSILILLLSVMTASVNAMQRRQQGAGVPAAAAAADIETGGVLAADVRDWTEGELRRHLGTMRFEGKPLTQEMIDAMVECILKKEQSFSEVVGSFLPF